MADHHADRLAAAERHHYQVADGGNLLARLLGPPTIIEDGVQGGVEGDLEDALFHELNVIPEKPS
jgi:hypothetical protein